MFFRPSTRRRPGWLAIALLGERACAALVDTPEAGLPRVQWIEALAWPEAQAGLQALRLAHAADQHALVGVLGRGQYQLSAIAAPELPRGEWRDALRWQLQELADFPMADASLDLLEIPAEFHARGRAPVLAVAAPHAPLAALAGAARGARVRWAAFDIVECALRNLSARCETPQRAQALLHVGTEHSTLVITAGGELLLSRSIDVPLSALQVDAARADGRDAFQAAADRIGLEIQRTLDSFERQFSDLAMARVCIAPSGLDDFIRHITDLVYTPVEPLALEQLFDLSALDTLTRDSLATPATQADALIALGAALRPALTPTGQAPAAASPAGDVPTAAPATPSARPAIEVPAPAPIELAPLTY